MTIPFLEPPGWVRVTDTDGRQRGFDPRYLVSCKEYTRVSCHAGYGQVTRREFLLTLAREGHTEFITIDEAQLAVVQRVFDDGL